MAALTWRNVDAPDFRGSMEGFKEFNRQLNSAFSTAKAGLNEYDQATSDRMNKMLAMELVGIQGDPDEYREKLPELLGKYDPNRISYENMTAANNKVGQLSSQALTDLNIESAEDNLEDTRLLRGRREENYAAKKAADPLLTQFYALSSAPDSPENQKKLADMIADPEFQKVVQGMGADEFAASMTNAMGLQRGTVGLTGDRMSNTIRSTEFNDSQEDRKDLEVARAAAFSTIDSVTDPEGFRDAILNNTGLNDRQKAIAYEYGMREYGSALTPVDFGGGGGGAAVAGGVSFGANSGTEQQHRAVADVLQGGGLSDVVVAGFLGNFAVEGGFAGEEGDGGTAGGIAQWRKERRDNFKRVIGKDPTKATHAEQAKFVLWELDNPDSGALGGTWQGRKVGPKEARDLIKNAKDPQEAAKLIDALYERSDGKARNKRSATAGNMYRMLTSGEVAQANAGGNTAVALSQNGNTVLEVQQMAVKNWGGETNPGTVAAGLVAEDGDYSGGNKSDMLGWVNHVMKKFGVNAGTAGAIIQRSVGEKSWDTFWSGVVGRGTGNVSVDENKVNELGKLFKNKKVLAEAAAAAEGDMQAVRGAQNTATALAQAEARVAQLQQMSRTRNVNKQLQDAIRDLEAIEASASANTANLLRRGGL